MVKRIGVNWSVTIMVLLISLMVSVGFVNARTLTRGPVQFEDLVVTDNIVSLTAASTLGLDQCSKTMLLNSATEFATTLPAVASIHTGCTYTFLVKAAPASASYTVITGNSLENILIGGINELEVDTGDDGPYIADGDTITFADGVAVVGDYVTMQTDGVSWYLHGQANADGGITLTQAD